VVKIIIFSVLILIANSNFTFASSFDTWKTDFYKYALSKGIKRTVLNKAKPYFQLNKIVIKLDRKQPEHKITFNHYIKNVLPKNRIRTGRKLLHKHFRLLNKISSKYGVKSSIIVALWGMESNFGQQMGGFNILESLSTLAYEGRRAKFFKRELINALRLMQENNIKPSKLQGSWAGAMGQSQFMPSTYRHYSVDYNRDGVRDIWKNHGDVFASIARYLSAEGWQSGIKWGREVSVSSKNISRYVGLKKHHSMDFWRKMGARTILGRRLPVSSLKSYLIQPDGVGGRSFLVYDNYLSIMKWNRSTYFATAIGLFSDSLE